MGGNKRVPVFNCLQAMNERIGELKIKAQNGDVHAQTYLGYIYEMGRGVNKHTNGKPNIVFLLADDQALISMGCYGNNDALTPNLDRLSKKGVTFDNHYVTTAICEVVASESLSKDQKEVVETTLTIEQEIQVLAHAANELPGGGK